MNSDNIIEAHHSSRDLAANQFDDAEWTKASPVAITRYWSGAEAPTGRHAEARLIWTKEALHVRYSCKQTEALVVNTTPQTAKKTIGLWDRDVCEIFLAPDPNVPERYLEFEAAPTGEWIDLAIHVTPEKRETDWEFHSGMTAAARIEKNRVLITLRLPWDHWIHKPQKGERWRANLFRCVGGGETRGYLAWRPTLTPEPSFHVPQAFGWLRFA
ncbi:MAG TPA: carbohydrate-binding family 9-like protein [Pyrinomonadaceae bacterium]|nr:carbohydrate-binding family 9-like protein [Pyrinomonadaceae bacterium]